MIWARSDSSAPSSGAARYWPGIRAKTTTVTSSRAAEATNGAAASIPNRRAPRGGPTKTLLTVWVADSRELATSSWSRSTRSLTSAGSPPSVTTSPTPTAKAVAEIRAMLAFPLHTTADMAATTVPRPAWASMAARRRSTRSSITPAGSPTSRKGRKRNTETRATSLASSVRRIARRGKATRLSPSARLLAVKAAQSDQNRRPNPDPDTDTSFTTGDYRAAAVAGP